MKETTVETKQCKNCGIGYPITNYDMEFFDKISPIIAGKKFTVPAPTHCPDCRQQRRLAFRNDRSLYKSVCASSGKEIISVYSPDKNYVVYDRTIWQSDKWNPLDYGRDYDFNKPFFQQFDELLHIVPRANIVIDNSSENCQYSNQDYNCKNCYLAFACSTSESCYYGNRVNYSNFCVDCLLIKNSEYCYECVDSFNSFNCAYCQKILNCSESKFLYDCHNCSNCFFCVGLRNKKYCIENKQYSKQEYFDKLAEFELDTYEGTDQIKKNFLKFIQKFPKLYANLNKTENTTGDNIVNAKNCGNVFEATNLENVKYCYFIDDSKDCMDVNYGCDNTVLNYDVSTSGIDAYKVIFSIDTWPNVTNIMYCDNCSNNVRDCFGCSGLHNGEQYCILNKQYSKQKYEELMPEIIDHMQSNGEWGDFFPVTNSPYAYNESVAQDYFPMTQDQILTKGYEWADPIDKSYSGDEYTPLDITQYNEEKTKKEIADSNIKEIMTGILKCKSTGRPFKIIRQELDFYIKMGLPIPRKHPDQRHHERLSQKNPRKLRERNCDKCGVDIKTSYSAEKPDLVYCENCYNKKIY